VSAPPAYLVIGRIGRPHGLRGEVKVQPETDFPDRFDQLRRVYLIGDEGGSTVPPAVEVEGVRRHGPTVLVKLAGTDSPEAARTLAGLRVAVPWEERMPLPPGAFYVSEIVGLRVRAPDGTPLGRVAEVVRTAAHDLYRVEGPSGEIMLPATREIIRAVDLQTGEIVAALPPGMMITETGADR